MLHKRWLRRIGITFMVFCIGLIPVRLAIAYYQMPQPQTIFVLGGTPEREKTAALLARYYPDLDIWISTGEQPERTHAIFAAARIPPDRLHLDYRATDTVTNFTTLLPVFQHHQIQHLYLVTSDFHMPRARAIATIVLGSRGICFTAVAVPSQHPPEPFLPIARDVGRSLLWLLTGRTGASLKSTR